MFAREAKNCSNQNFLEKRKAKETGVAKTNMY